MSEALVKSNDLTPSQPPGLLKSWGLALLAHALLVFGLMISTEWKLDNPTATAEAELWSAVPQQAAPEAAAPAPSEEVKTEPDPKPLPKSAPPSLTPDQDHEAEIALARKRTLQKEQEEKARLVKIEQQRLKQQREAEAKEAKRKAQEKREKERERQEIERKQEEKKLADQKREEQRKNEAKEREKAQKAEAKRLEALRQENLNRVMRQASSAGGTGQGTGAVSGAGGKGMATQSSGPSAGYAGKIRAKIKPNIIFTEEITGNPEAEVEVRASPDGTILKSKLTKSSGNKAWDEAVLRAIDKTEVLPKDSDGRAPSTLIITFRPKD